MVAAEEFAEGRENRIYIFSDMIENSDYLSGKDFSRKPNDALIAMLEQDRLIQTFRLLPSRCSGSAAAEAPSVRRFRRTV